jgi:hypothetical protein
MHHPINRHDMIWATNIRPDPACKGSYSDDHYTSFPQLSAPRIYAASQAIAVPIPARINQFEANKSGSNGPQAPLAPAVKSAVPSKRPLEREQQAVASTPGTQTVQPMRPAAVSTSVSLPPYTCAFRSIVRWIQRSTGDQLGKDPLHNAEKLMIMG